MAIAQVPADLTLDEHRRRAGSVVDAAIDAAASAYRDYAAIPEVRALRDASPDELRSIVIVLLDRATSGPGILALLSGNSSGAMRTWQIGRVLGTLSSKRPPFSRADVLLMLRFACKALGSAGINDGWTDVGIAGQPVSAAERAVAEGGVGELAEPIRALAEQVGKVRAYGATQAAKYQARLLALLATAPASAANGSNVVPVRRPPKVSVDPKLIRADDPWGRVWRSRAAELEGSLAALVVHCSLASGVVPAAAWRKRARELAAEAGAGELLRAMLDDTLAAAAAQTSHKLQYEGRTYVSWDPAMVDSNVVLVRGAIWAASTVPQPWVEQKLLAIGLHFGTSGGTSNEARDERLANTCAAALGSRGGTEAISALGRLKAKVGNRNVSRQIAKALEAASAAAGISPSELLELAVPTNGLDATGRREVAVADHTAVLTIEGDGVSLTWRAPDGRVSSNVPTALAEQRAAVAAVKDEAKELRKALGLERGRVEDLFTEGREWAIADWRARYLDHPVTGSIARRLIWAFLPGGEAARRIAAMPDGDGFTDAAGRQVEVGLDDRVRPWHPIDADETEIAAWRGRLVERQIRQPFKQAFREVYLLTPAEELTELYSNRFAAHILSYPQARALMTTRRWGSNFLGPFDGGFHGIAKREFPTHGIRAEFWHDAIEDQMERFRTSVEHCSTDQLRFLRVGRVDDLMPLRDVPPILFSEAMRDVDLFVSVTSVGADRVWQDGGLVGANRFAGYWGASWDQPLTATAAVRRDALARMLPGLAIADRLELEDRWLVVRGELRSYKIHLGSGNILMLPADTYLCIVPARGGPPDTVFLPFDDDPTLSVILSKAFLLAMDAKIADRSITAQIKRG
jgi:hypothetical protein